MTAVASVLCKSHPVEKSAGSFLIRLDSTHCHDGYFGHSITTPVWTPWSYRALAIPSSRFPVALEFMSNNGVIVTKIQPATIPPRGLNVRQAAKYFGVSVNTLKKLTSLGLAPAPIRLPGVWRNVYDRVALDAAMSARAVTS